MEKGPPQSTSGIKGKSTIAVPSCARWQTWDLACAVAQGKAGLQRDPGVQNPRRSGHGEIGPAPAVAMPGPHWLGQWRSEIVESASINSPPADRGGKESWSGSLTG